MIVTSLFVQISSQVHLIQPDPNAAGCSDSAGCTDYSDADALLVFPRRAIPNPDDSFMVCVRIGRLDVEFCDAKGEAVPSRLSSLSRNPMHDTSPTPHPPGMFEDGLFAPISSSDVVLGYPETEPPAVDMGPVPSGVGAKPSGKSGVTAKTQPKLARPAENKPAGPPLPKRPKGRLFVGSVLLMVIVGLAFTVFQTTLRYTAYGEVIGRKIELAVPWPGVVQSIHVREGDHVEVGDFIARIDSLEMRQKIEEIDDSLRLERARLASELAMLRWEAEKIRDIHKLSLSEFYDKWSELLWEQSRLADLRTQVKRIEPIFREGAASEERLESLKFQFAGQEKRVEQLTEAVRALKMRSDESPIDLALEDRVQPTLVRIENLQAELQRTRQTIRQGEIRATAAGRIVRTHRFAGEYADQTKPVAELFVEGSTELVLYLPQSAVQDYPIGRTVTLYVSSIDTNVPCQVQRIGMQMQRAPQSLESHYRPNESLLPVYLQVTDSTTMPSWLALGSEVRLPRSESISALSRLRRWWRGDAVHQADTVRPIETASPLRTATGEEPLRESADKKLMGQDGRTASWIQ